MLEFFIISTVFNTETFEDFRNSIEPNCIIVGFHTDKSDFSQDKFYYQLYQNVSVFEFPENFYLCRIVNETDPNYVSVYFPGTSESEISINLTTNSSYLIQNIISSAKHLIKHYKRLLKKMKQPEIARIKEELRHIRKMIQRETNSTKIGELLLDQKQLELDFLRILPPEKQAKRKIVLKKKITKNREEKERIINQLKMNRKENEKTLTPEKMIKKGRKKLFKAIRNAKQTLTDDL